ncbi:hypothetical protein EWX14_14370 [Enterococcus faecalis]|nr:hypothetical protein [Enterococcus faecalis]
MSILFKILIIKGFLKKFLEKNMYFTILLSYYFTILLSYYLTTLLLYYLTTLLLYYFTTKNKFCFILTYLLVF